MRPEARLPTPPAIVAQAISPAILIVEDNAVNAMILRAMLSKNGYETVVVASSGREGIALSDQHRPGLILMDLQMPSLDGFATASAIRAACNGAAPAIVAVTANAGPEVLEACLEAGFASVLAKPIVLGDLLTTVRRVLGA